MSEDSLISVIKTMNTDHQKQILAISDNRVSELRTLESKLEKKIVDSEKEFFGKNQKMIDELKVQYDKTLQSLELKTRENEDMKKTIEEISKNVKELKLSGGTRQTTLESGSIKEEEKKGDESSVTNISPFKKSS